MITIWTLLRILLIPGIPGRIIYPTTILNFFLSETESVAAVSVMTSQVTRGPPRERRFSVTRTTDTDLPFLESFWWCACLAGTISAVGVVETAAGVRFGLASAASLVWIVLLASAARWYLKIARPLITHAPNSVFALDGTLTSAVHGGMCPSLSSPKPIVPP